MEKTKSKGKKIVLLVCGIVLALALIAGGVTAVLFMNSTSVSEEEAVVEYSGEVRVQDEQTLRDALAYKGKCAIVLEDDIVITKELGVMGDKTIRGGSIIMDMRREGSNESVLAIQRGATLVLDGTTVDGNSVVNCISIKAGGQLDSKSGSLLYGYPYGLDVAGKATISDILIEESLHTAINVAIFGEVDMQGGTIRQNVYGIAVAEDGIMEIADGVTMERSVASFVVNYGEMEIYGGKYDGSNDNAIENWGTMTVKGTESDPVEICNGKKSAINAKNSAKLTVEHVNIHDMAWHGMCVEKNTTATLKNITYDTTGKSTLYVNSAKVTAENIIILNGTAYGVYGTKNADVTMTNVTIKNMGHRAVVNELSVLTADGLVIENSLQHGVYTTGDGAVTIVNNATITGTERSGFAVAKGKGTITNSHIADTTRECVSVAEPGTAIVEDCTIDNAGNFGVASYGGVVNVKNTTITNSKNASVLSQDNGTVTGENLTIKNSAKQAIRAEKGGVANVTGCTINTTGAAAVYADGAKIVLKSAVINNPKTYGVAAKNCNKASGQMIQLDKVTVNNPGEHGIGSINAYMVAGNIKVTSPRRCGVYSEGDKAIINMAHVEVDKAGTCGLGFKGAAEITARNVTINNPTNEGIYATKGAIVKKLDNIIIKNPGTHGVSVEANSSVAITVDTKYNPENTKGNGVTVLNPGSNGIRVKEATLTAKNVTIKNAGGQGISANTESKVSVDGCTIDTTKQAAVYAGESKLSLKNATIDNAGSYAVAAQNCAKEKEQIVQLTNVEINKPGMHGVGSLNAYVVAGDVKVNEPKRCGMYTEGVGSIINMANIEVIKPGTSGFGFKGAAEITARNVTIKDAAEHGIYVEKDTTAKKLDNITITNPAKNGVYVNGEATVSFTVDTKYNPENTKGNGVTIINPGTKGLRCDKGTISATGVTIKNAGEQGIYAAKEGNVTVNGCSIDTTKQAAVYAENATLKLKNATIDNAGSYGVAAKNCTKEKEQIVQLTNVEINKPHERGIGSLHAYVVAGDIKITEPKGCGIYSEGDDAIINMANVEVTKAGSCGFGFAGAAEITARNVTITDPKNEGILVKDNANVKRLDNVVITNPGSFGLDVQSGSARITADTSYNPDNTQNVGMTIENATRHGIVIRTGATLSADGTTIKNSGERGIHNTGALTLVNSGVTIDGTVGHGIYMSTEASITGSGLTIKNAGDNGIFSEGAPIDITGMTVESTKNQGVQVKGGDVKISDFSMKETGGVAMRVRNDAKVNLTNGTIYADTYGIYCDGSTETIVSDVTVERTGKKSDPLAAVFGSAKLEIAGETKLDNKDHNGYGIAVDSANAVLILNGGSFVGEDEGYADVLLNRDGTAISLAKKLSESISLQPNKYEHSRVVAKKYESISDADFGSSMALLILTDDNWSVDNAGCLSNPDNIVASIGETTYTTLEAAVAAATGTDTIKILKDLTVSATIQIDKNVKIVADKAITITANNSQTGSIFYVTGGNLNITGATENAKITVASGVKTTNIVYNNGGNVVLTNVALAGNVNTTAGNNSTYGIYNNAGSVTVKSVTIKDIAKGDGINIRAGASADLDNVTISNCGRYGLKTYGTVNVYNTVHADKALSISNTTDHAIDIDNGGKLISNLTNVPAGTYAITIDTTTKSSARGIIVRAGGELNVTNISIKNTKSNGVDLAAATSVASISNASVGAEGYAIQTIKYSSLTVSNVTVLKCGATAVNILGNLNGEITFNHNIAHVDAVAADYDKNGNIEYWYCTICNTVWKDEARTQVITMAETVIPKLEGAVASIGNVKYASLEAAVNAANASEGADVINLLMNTTVKSQLKITGDVTITANQAVTVTADFANSLFNITSGTVAITGASETAKITFVSGVKTTNIVYNSGGTVGLTNVELVGNVNSTAGNTSTYGIYNNAGKVTAKSVTIHDVPKGDGINIRTGASADLDNVTITNCSRYGLKTYGTVNVYNTVHADNGLSISNTTDHGIDIDNGGKVLTHFANVPSGTYAFKIDTTTKSTARGVLVRAGGEFTATDVSIQNVKNNGVELLAATSVASITNATIAAEGYGINAAANSSLTLGNVTATGNPAGMNLAEGAKIVLTKALTQNITVQLGEYAEGVVVAEKAGQISDADFAASMALLIPVDTNWVVAGTGKLGKSACEHSWSEQITTQPTCTTDGVKTHTCSKCGNSYTEAISAAGHTVARVAFVAPSLEAAGNMEYWRCSVCNTIWEDAAQTKVTDLASVTLPKVEAGNVAYMNGEAFQTLEAAIAKADQTAAADTIYLLSNVTVAAQIAPTTDMTIAATKAVTITINSSLNAYPFTVASGKTLTVEGVGSGRITVASTSTAKEVFYNQGTLNLTNVSVFGGKYAVNNRADTLNLTNVTITGTADNGIHLAGGTTTVTNVTISNTKGHGIGCYANLELQPAVSGGVALTIDTTGTSSAKKHGIYASYNASITGSGLSIQNATNAGFFGDYDTSKSTVGVTVELTNVTVKNTGAQGIQAKKGIVTISDFTITGTGSAALRPYDSKGNVTFNLSNGTVTTGTYGLAMDKSTHSVVLNNVVFERTGTKTEAVLSVTNSATLTATNVTVNIPSAFTALSINGAASYEGITVTTKEQNG